MIPIETEKTVHEFYISQHISRQMPGMQDIVSIFLGEKQHVHKHLVLCNLKEVYELFKAHHQDIKIGLSKFADLRPRQCVSRIK